jgi:hypothetical protein
MLIYLATFNKPNQESLLKMLIYHFPAAIRSGTPDAGTGLEAQVNIPA